METALDTADPFGSEVRDELARIRRLVADVVGPPVQSSALTRRPIDVADEVVDGWQHEAARSGLLLSVEVDGGEHLVRVDWAAALASMSAVLDGCVRCSSPGGLVVTLTTSAEGASVRVVAGGLRSERGGGVEATTHLSALPEPSTLADALAMARVIVEWAAGRLDVSDSDGATIVELAVPAVGGETD